LFIAIVVDTYIIRKEQNEIAVKDLDVDEFARCWSLYDNYATGEIKIEDFDDFILDLS
jgi:hypothetical protein